MYRSVYENKDLLAGKDVTLFVTGSYMGLDNSFDEGRASLEKFCTWEEIFELQEMGCKIGWHTWTHPDLTKLSDEDLLKEITPPFPMETFAYPYGLFDKRVIEAVSQQFKKAYSVTEGDNSDYQLLRSYL